MDNCFDADFFETIQNSYNKQLTQFNKEFLHYGIYSMVVELIIKMEDGYLDCSYERLVNQQIRMILKILGFDNSEIESILRNAQIIFLSFDLNMEQNFFINFSQKTK